MGYDLRLISLGAGVQSSAMYLMACEGELTPMPDAAIFADTQAEPPWVYEHLEFLETFAHIIPIHRCTGGSIEKKLYWGRQNGGKGFVQIPAYLSGLDGRGIGPRQCTGEFKITPIQKEVRRLLGLSKGQRAAGKFKVEQWIGISLDEIQRAKPSDVSWIKRHYPLIFDRPTDRAECSHWIQQRGYPLPKKSSCYFCPYHDDKTWLDLKRSDPALFARAVQIDNDLRAGEMRCSDGLTKQQFLHSGLKPLGETEFRDEDQLDLFTNECEGVCGV